MLVLTRKPTEEIHIGDGVTITILRVRGQCVRVGIKAPDDVRIVRSELRSTEKEAAPSHACPVAPMESASVIRPERSRPLSGRSCQNRMLAEYWQHAECPPTTFTRNFATDAGGSSSRSAPDEFD